MKDNTATKQSAAHTVLPWFTSTSDPKFIRSNMDGGLIIAEATYRPHAKNAAEQHANAALIVRAVNAHAELVAALGESVTFYDARLAAARRSHVGHPSEFDPRREPSASEAGRRERARAILARVDGGK